MSGEQQQLIAELRSVAKLYRTAGLVHGIEATLNRTADALEDAEVHALPDRETFVQLMEDVAESYSIHDGDERRYSERVYDALFGQDGES